MQLKQMKLLVVSDTHGKRERLRCVMDMHKDADALLFLGDGLADLWRADAENYPFALFRVKGNCDSFLSANTPEELTLTLGNFKFLMLHGHTRGVKHSVQRAALAAAEAEADVLLYGHTHMRCEQYIPESAGSKALYLFNPGSLGDSEASYGLIEIHRGQMLFSHGSLNKQ